MKYPLTQFARTLWLSGLALLLASLACNLGAPPPPTAVPTATITFTPTNTATTAPTDTPTITYTPSITLTPSRTIPPTATPTITPTPYPTVPPQATIAIALDKFQTLTLDQAVRDSIGQVWLSIINLNDAAPQTLTPGTVTAPDTNDTASVYLIMPSNPNTRLKILDVPAATDKDVYWSPNGAYVAYYLNSGSDSGIYLINLENAFTSRLFMVDNLNPRGISSPPVWSPDSKLFTITFNTAYDVDIFSISPDGTNFRNLTNHPALDFWPSWSPDGRYLAFLSDRVVCPTWEPNAPQSCYRPDAPPPTGGNAFVLDMTTGQIRQLSDAWVTAPPQWITHTRLSLLTGQRDAQLANNGLAWVDLNTNQMTVVVDGTKDISAQNPAWTADGKEVIYQEVSPNGNTIVLADDQGQEISRISDFTFPRFGFAAAWSPDGQRVFLGGRGGQCPYGVIVLDFAGKVLAQSTAAPAVCEPMWSPDGKNVAFVGVQTGANSGDGNFDVYIAAPSGGGVRNATGRFGGQIRFLGWVGRNP